MTTFDYKSFLSRITEEPGIYVMFDEHDVILYVGKAKNLKKRLASYFREHPLSTKTGQLVLRIHRIQVTVTATEAEALLLENNLIKHHRPKYNIIFRDDKSYPYLYLSHHPYPKLMTVRGKPYAAGHYFGPYPSMHVVKQTLNLFQKIFKVRSCDEMNFKSRNRPCLMHQIQRCSAPCVNYISKEDYAQDMQGLKSCLLNDGEQVINSLIKAMEVYSEALAFEKAARVRDQIQELQKLRGKQAISSASVYNIDVIAVAQHGLMICIDILFIRNGQMIENKPYIHSLKMEEPAEVVLQKFIEHYYLEGLGSEMLPSRVILGQDVEGLATVAESLKSLGKKPPVWKCRPRQWEEKNWLDLAKKNADVALEMHLRQVEVISYQLDCLAESLGLDEPIAQMECFDVSHSSGEKTVASCVVMTREGLAKKEYRQFNIDDITGGDDYAAIHQAVLRRYQRLKTENKPLPSVILIDGGKGQLSHAYQALKTLELEHIPMLSIAKGPERKEGVEQLFYGPEGKPLFIPHQDAARMVIQRLRDESHRFALKTHRSQRDKLRRRSLLQDIPGVGPKRRQILLNHFGGLDGLKQASVSDIERLPGISRAVAEQVIAFFKTEKG